MKSWQVYVDDGPMIVVTASKILVTDSGALIFLDGAGQAHRVFHKWDRAELVGPGSDHA